MKQLGVNFNYKAYKDGKVVYTSTRQKKLLFLNSSRTSWAKFAPDKMTLKVLYGKGHSNTGVYTTKKDWEFAYQAFTEQSLINYISGSK